jgi:hypothetical protein
MTSRRHPVRRLNVNTERKIEVPRRPTGTISLAMLRAIVDLPETAP